MQLGANCHRQWARVTSIAVFLEGRARARRCGANGAAYVTADIARMLASPLSAAERIKTLYGAALGDIETGTDVVAVPQMGENGRIATCAFRARC